MNRNDAGHQLAKALSKYKNSDAIILAIPRGGVPIGKIVADDLGLPLEILLSKKIGHPFQKEYAIGAVSLSTSVLNDTEDVTDRYIQAETHRLRQMLREKYGWYYKSRPQPIMTGRTVIIVDDGAATGFTLLSTAELINQHMPSQLVIGLPVASKLAMNRLRAHDRVDEVICVLQPQGFTAVGNHYRDFSPVTDQEVYNLLKRNGKAGIPAAG